MLRDTKYTLEKLKELEDKYQIIKNNCDITRGVSYLEKLNYMSDIEKQNDIDKGGLYIPEKDTNWKEMKFMKVPCCYDQFQYIVLYLQKASNNIYYFVEPFTDSRYIINTSEKKIELINEEIGFKPMKFKSSNLREFYNYINSKNCREIANLENLYEIAFTHENNMNKNHVTNIEVDNDSINKRRMTH